jgi:hypothetical protein
VKARKHIRIWLAASILTIALSVSARAQFTTKDAQILGRTLGYTGDGMTGVVVVGIVFTAANQQSRQEAEMVRSVIGDGVASGRVQLQARLVPVDQLAGTTGVNALYIASGLGASTEAIFSAAERLRVPTIAASLSCVEAGRCVVGFTSEPTVQILINQGAAERIGVHFLQAFRMLVREQ